MELKTSVTSVKFSEEEKYLCENMHFFLGDIIKTLDNSDKMGLQDYYGGSWDREILSDFYDFCSRVMNPDNKQEDEWELE